MHLTNEGQETVDESEVPHHMRRARIEKSMRWRNAGTGCQAGQPVTVGDEVFEKGEKRCQRKIRASLAHLRKGRAHDPCSGQDKRNVFFLL